ncbi:MAG: DUF1232 domain-containing protein [Candidatus Cloacimonetes bacterium]|nr:DUF1232 domain-containing protein [Candidatus Cloacimonadota bacterium]
MKKNNTDKKNDSGLFVAEEVKNNELEVINNPERRFRFYEILRRRIHKFVKNYTGETGSRFAGYLLSLPDFFIMLCRLALDTRVNASQKLFVGGITAYVILPIDIVPDFIPFLGYIDDLVLVVFGLNLILNELDKQILLDNWSGEDDVLELLQKITITAERFLDKTFLKRIQNWLSGHRKQGA